MELYEIKISSYNEKYNGTYREYYKRKENYNGGYRETYNGSQSNGKSKYINCKEIDTNK